MGERRLTIYLAGPITNCGEEQKNRWRKDLRAALHLRVNPRPTVINPAETQWGPLKEIEEIDASDVVIANMWRESIGTTVGIVHARRTGKPVILIDPNYLDSKILRELVGRRPARSVDEAVEILIKKVAPEANQSLQVRKADGSLQPFSLTKLHRSLDAFLDAGLDVWLPSRIHAEVRKAAVGSIIETSAIKATVFRVLDDVAAERPREKQRALVRREAWNRYAGLKRQARSPAPGLADLLSQLEEARAEIERNKIQVRELEEELQQVTDARNSFGEQLLAAHSATTRSRPPAPPPPTSLAMQIRERTGGRRILCVNRPEHTTVRDALLRRGVQADEFSALFVERPIPKGQNSNFNKHLKHASKSYSFAIYAWEGLRHADTHVKQKFEKFFQACRADEAVKLFLSWVDGAGAAAAGSPR